jgi:23S rRNA (guanosine2251-2'-O)-methyltransferase
MLLTGYHAIAESLRREAGGELLVCRSNPRIAELEALARAAGVPVRRVPGAEMDALAGAREHRGAGLLLAGEGRSPPQAERSAQEPQAARAAGLRERLAAVSGPTALILLLDEIADPHNLGAILRSADQFAVELVVIPTRRAAHETPAVAKASSGASLYVPLLSVPNLGAALQLAKEAGFWVYGADLSGERLDEVRFEGRVALVLGSEGGGLRRLVRERCDALVRIPAGGHVDSFNVSVAAGILIYEIRKQQCFPGFP